MSDYIPYYKLIPEHDGQHHVFEKVFPQRPYHTSLTSTIEATWSCDYMTNLCQHRTDSALWHGRYEDSSQALYSGCLNVVTTFIDHDEPIDLVVLEGGQRILERIVEPKIYRILLPTTRGLNHILWCDNMEITHCDHTYLENIVPKLPNIPTKYVNPRVVASISFPEIGDSSLYKRLGDQLYFTKRLQNPGEYFGSRTVMSHVPNLEVITKKNENKPTGIRIVPKWIHMITKRTKTPPYAQTPPSLFAQAYFKSSPIIDDWWAKEGEVPPYLSERYIHLRYKSNENVENPYRYRHGWTQGTDIRTLFEKSPIPNYMDMGRYDV
jgi:hypothetical protein